MCLAGSSGRAVHPWTQRAGSRLCVVPLCGKSMRNLPLPSRTDDRIHLEKAIRTYVSKGIVRGHDITADELNEVIAIYDRYDVDLAQPCDLLKGTNLPETLRQAI